MRSRPSLPNRRCGQEHHGGCFDAELITSHPAARRRHGVDAASFSRHRVPLRASASVDICPMSAVIRIQGTIADLKP